MEDIEEKRIIVTRDISLFFGFLSFIVGYYLLQKTESLISGIHNATIALLIFAVWGCLHLYWYKLGSTKSKFQSRFLIVAVVSIVGAIVAVIFEVANIVKP